jgi:hypothetical protein
MTFSTISNGGFVEKLIKGDNNMNSEIYNIQIDKSVENNTGNQYVADEGESYAIASLISGILSLFCFPSSIVSLIFASKYKKTGNGNNAKKTVIGKVFSIISIVFKILFLITGICFTLSLNN